jgi:apolipoprotein N-acyltransferase
MMAGMSLVAAFSPVEWRALSVVSPAVLMIIGLQGTPREAFRRGYLFGLGFFAVGISWVYNSIHEFGQAPVLLAAFITLIFVLYLSLYPALTGALAVRNKHISEEVSLIVVWPAIWTTCEWLRSWLLTGFPWLLLGQANVDTFFAGIIPVLGVLGATWLNMLTAGLLVVLLRSSGRVRWAALAGILGVIIALVILQRVTWTATTGDRLTASLVQANVAQNIKWERDQFLPTLVLYRKLSRLHWESDLILWPETAVPAYYSVLENGYFKPLAREARAHNAEVLVGVLVQDSNTHQTYNSLVKLGNPVEFYHKRHLVPFGEYFPLRYLLSWMKDQLVIPMSDLSAGKGPPLLQLSDYQVGVSICYEDAYGNKVIDALPQAQLLVNVSNDAWFGDSLAPHQHLEIARGRALETERYLLRATNTGISAVINPKGLVIAQSPQFETDVLTAEVYRKSGTTPYAMWGNWAVVTLLLVILIIIAVTTYILPRDRLLMKRLSPGS